jgi:hypothetical protein
MLRSVGILLHIQCNEIIYMPLRAYLTFLCNGWICGALGSRHCIIGCVLGSRARTDSLLLGSMFISAVPHEVKAES